MKHNTSVLSTLTMCILVLSVGWLPAQNKDGATEMPSVRADRLIRELPDAHPSRRIEIVTELHSLATTKTSDSSFSLYQFGYIVTTHADGTATMKPLPDRNKVLSRVIPLLIDLIDDKEQMASKPWWILISLQGSCPEPKKATWQRWWKETGSKTFQETK